MNVATYGPGGRWAMTDRGAGALRRTADTLAIGPSRMHWTGTSLVIDIDEATVPHLTRLRGRIEVTPAAVTGVDLALTPDRRHVWRPFAPVSRISVDLGRPGWAWEGHGYLDGNFGTAALEADFSYWTWGRFPTAAGATCFYEAIRRDGSELAAGLSFGRDGSVTRAPMPPKARLPRSLWAVRRETRADAGATPRQKRGMLDAPFYTRSVVETRLQGETVTGVHEALDLDRFRSPWLMPMLALKVPRRRGQAG